MNGPVALGGPQVQATRPRGPGAESQEIEPATWKTSRSTDFLSSLVVERVPAGVATRQHADLAKPVGDDLERRSNGSSKTTISRRFVKATEIALAEPMARSLTHLDVCFFMVVGLTVPGSSVVVALVITTTGTTVPVGLRLGDTESTAVVTALPAALTAPGLSAPKGILCALDGAKALVADVKKVYSDQAAILWCTLHKRCNVGHLPKEFAGSIDKRLAAIFSDTDADRALTLARCPTTELQADHSDASGSLCEGLKDMFTVRRMGITGPIARTLTNINCIDSMISIARRTTDRVANWEDGQ